MNKKLTQVLHIKPLERVTFINFDLNLSKYLTPNVTDPIITVTRPMIIAVYSYFASIAIWLGVNINISAANGAETFISLAPWAIASIQIETVSGRSNNLSIL